MAKKEPEEFDVNQGHGDHIGCVTSLETSQFVVQYLRDAVKKGAVIADIKEPIACNFGEDMPGPMPMILLGELDKPIRLNALIAVNERGKQNTLVSGYPEYDGAEVAVKITEIHEWAAGVEASIDGEVLGDAERRVCFFDTRYVAHKGKYVVGNTYTFRLCAFAYRAEIVPESEREFRIEGESAVKRRKDLGEEQKYDANGNPEPLIFRMDKMVAYYSISEAYPDDAQYQSPVFGEVNELAAFDEQFVKVDIAIARDEDDVVIPMLVRKSLLESLPKKDDPVRGTLWLQGYCVD